MFFAGGVSQHRLYFGNYKRFCPQANYTTKLRHKNATRTTTTVTPTPPTIDQTVLQSRAEALPQDSRLDSKPTANAHPTLALV